MEDSFQPPTVDAANPTATGDAAATSTEPLYPAWVLLEKGAWYDESENATTAEAQTFIGHTVRVTFFLADPPAVSCFGVHGPDLEQKDFFVLPRAVFSEKDLVLFRFVFTLRPHSAAGDPNPAQYFVYKAGHGKPSLTPVPTSGRPNSAPSYSSVLPFEDEAGDFLVADLAPTGLGYYDLHLFSSKTNEWTTRTSQLQVSPTVIAEHLPSIIHKVIALGAGTMGWIDLWRGIVVCNVFDPDPVLRFIPLPKPQFNSRLEGDPQQTRDVTCCNGLIKFIDMEHCAYSRWIPKTTKDLDSALVLYDSEHVSWNLWCKGHTLHVDDILVKTPSYYTMLPELWDDSAGKFTLRNLTAVCPTLSVDGGDVVYLVSKVAIYDKEAWVVGVDLRKKTVEVLEPYCAARYSLHETPFLAATFSGYLNTTPRSCAPEDQNYPLSGLPSPGDIFQNNLQNMQIVHPANSFQFHPQFVVPPHSFPQTLPPNFIPSGPGFGQLRPLMPLDNRFQPQMPRESASSAVPFNTLMTLVPASPAMPFNTLMPRVPMDERFLSQMPPVPAYQAVHHN